ncbi:MAG: toll/interleukin-1 receptor domain-containing protein, partial [Caulobacterales bacterium]|nr:toll/interleukin-1 receptor domain-containing protein [Caulobacterales bacterium]
MADVFISYPRRERARVEPIMRALERLGLDVFADREPHGPAEAVEAEVKVARAVLGCWSPTALARPLVRQECLIGQERGVLVPIAIEPLSLMDVPPSFVGINYADLSDFDGDPAHSGWLATLRALESKLGRDDLVARAEAVEA